MANFSTYLRSHVKLKKNSRKPYLIVTCSGNTGEAKKGLKPALSLLMDEVVNENNVSEILARLISDNHSTDNTQEGYNNRGKNFSNANKSVTNTAEGENYNRFVYNIQPSNSSTPKKPDPTPHHFFAPPPPLQVPQLNMQRSESMDTSQGEVFRTPANSRGTASSSSVHPNMPPEYSTIRAARKNSRQVKTLTGTQHLQRGKATAADCGSFVVEDDSRLDIVKKFHIPALKRNATASAHRAGLGDPLLCTSCDEKHRLDALDPICIVLADQNFPPALPVGEGLCTCILRIEDALLAELPDLLVEYFGRGKQCAIPENSVILFGSLSHLAQRGLANYTEELVRTANALIACTNKKINISHYTYTPLGGVEDPCLIRELLDLDCWLGTDINLHSTLPRARATLWETILEQGENCTSSSCDTRRYYIPASVTNARKMHFTSPQITTGLPEKIIPFTAAEEEKVIMGLLSDVESTYGIKTGSPLFERSCATEQTGGEGSKRLAIVGGSHAKRIGENLESLGVQVLNCAVGGWTLNKTSGEALTARITGLDIGTSTIEDVVVLDLLSNSAYGGTDEEGCPQPAQKLSDGKWHVIGDITPQPPSVIRAKLKIISGKLPVEKNLLYILVVPIPRYLTEACCGDSTHCVNRNDPTLMSEVIAATKKFEEVLRAFGVAEQLNHTVVNPLDVLNITAERNSLVMDNGQLIWPPGSPVHLSGAAYLALAEDILQHTVFGSSSEDTQQSEKRLRLDSVVVRPKTEAVVRPQINPGWSSGTLPGGRGTHGHWRGGGGGRGGRKWRPRYGGGRRGH